MDKTIFLGNGLNRCISSDIAWKDLLKQISNTHELKYCEGIPLPMHFEALINQLLVKGIYQKDDVYGIIKSELCDTIAKIDNQAIELHKLFSQLTNSFITTNYDFLIEKSIDNSIKIDEIKSHFNANNKYNFNSYAEVNNKKVFHIHGNRFYSNSICLGYEHYVGTVQNLRNMLNSKNYDGKNYDTPAIIRHFSKNGCGLNCWATKFFTDDIHIVGFGLSDAEIDIWWLITYRAFLFYTDKCNAKSYIKNKIVYHHISYEENLKLKYMLEKNNVVYDFHKLTDITDENYKEQYIKIADKIGNSK